MKYLTKLTIEDIKEISHLCSAKVYHNHHEHIGTYGPKSILIVLENGSEFYISDFGVKYGSDILINSMAYIKYMCFKFGEEYINDYVSNLYDSEIEDLKRKIADINKEKKTKLSELKQYTKVQNYK